MITDDKIGIGFGRLAPMDEFGEDGVRQIIYGSKESTENERMP